MDETSKQYGRFRERYDLLGISYRSIAEDYLGAALIRPVDYVIIIMSRYLI